MDQEPGPSTSREVKKWKQKLVSTWNSVKYNGVFIRNTHKNYENRKVIHLGKIYFTHTNDTQCGFEQFFSDYYSRIWITYKTGIENFPGTTIGTDCGWGCMLRTTQMMTAQVILHFRLGRDWRYDQQQDSKDLEILKLFEDKPQSSLGVHSLIRNSVVEFGQNAGSWFAPGTSAFLMRSAINSSSEPLIADISMSVSIDGLVYSEDLDVETRNWSKKLFLVVVLRFGTDKVNQVYIDGLKVLFQSPNFVGIAGGRPNHSVYFTGYSDEELIYLDPHVAKQYEPLQQSCRSYREMDPSKKEETKHPLENFHCKLLSKMRFDSMDPSCAIGFVFGSKAEFDRTVSILNLEQVIDVDLEEGAGRKRVETPLFSVSYNARPIIDSTVIERETYDFEVL